ncbi:hypothetical protein [Winogradskyella flava]|uniref:Uncharacterized protein n=1 Tax=Winogradskyella flava TaxID=1884876 RepID=A0A842ITW6_9FLAO|nr:hypothetical protein [Winogradskyella flava]MBC2846490.1 hypothetical protein [Winogradskyella flava]
MKSQELIQSIIAFLAGCWMFVIQLIIKEYNWSFSESIFYWSLGLPLFIATYYYIYKTGGKSIKANIILLGWAGFSKHFKKYKNSIRKLLNIKLETTDYYGQDLFKELDKINPHLIIFDIEATPRLLELKNQNSLVPISDIGLTISNVNSSIPYYLYPKYESVEYGLPIAFGTNSISINTEAVPNHIHSLKEIFFGDSEFTKRLYRERKIGIWDWYLPTMGIISLSLGHSDPYQLNETQFQNLCEHLLKLKKGVNKFYWGNKGFKRLKQDLNDGDVWIIPGGGEWHRPTKRSKSFFANNNDKVGSIILDEGAIAFVRCIGLTKNGMEYIKKSKVSTNDIVQLISNYALSDFAQKELLENHLYPLLRVDFRNLNKEAYKAMTISGFPSADYLNEMFIRRKIKIREYPLENNNKDFVTNERWIKFWVEEFGGKSSY